MPARLTGDKERTPFRINVTYVQREAMRKELNKKNAPYNTYGKLVMAVIHGERDTLAVRDNKKSTDVTLKLHLTMAEQAEIMRMSFEEDVTPTAFVRNRVFGEEYRSRKKFHNNRRVTIDLNPDKETVYREVLRLIGSTASLPQGIDYLASLMAHQLLAASLENNNNTDLMDKAVETE